MPGKQLRQCPPDLLRLLHELTDKQIRIEVVLIFQEFVASHALHSVGVEGRLGEVLLVVGNDGVSAASNRCCKYVPVFRVVPH